MRRIFWRSAALAFPLILALTGVMAWQFYWALENQVIARFSSHRWDVPSKIYADEVLLYPGIDTKAVDLFGQLTRLDYRFVQGPVQSRGEYFYDPKKGELQVFLHDFFVSEQRNTPQRVSVVLRDTRIVQIVDLEEGTPLPAVALEPEIIAGVYDQDWSERRVMKFYEVPSLLVKAILAAEDHRFFEHEGIDWRRILGAGWANVLAGRPVQGGSTITQQLVKNFFLSQEKTIGRKLVEVCMAMIVEHHYSKLEILENYLNEIYLGQKGAKGIFGMWEAARVYFGKEPRDLTLGEMATLAGIIKAPNAYAPNRHSDRAIERRNYVLQRMRELGDIAEEEYRAALHERFAQREVQTDDNGAPYFADLIRKELEAAYSVEQLTTGGLRVFTSLNMRLQRLAQEMVRSGLQDLEAKYPRLRRKNAEDRLQACLIAVQPQTGAVRAMVGGRDYQESQFNRVTQAHRQPGSIFKPIVYLTALAEERKLREGRFLPTSYIEDAPFTWVHNGTEWTPGNYRNQYSGQVTLRRALEMSLNTATARVAQHVGLEAIRGTAARIGFVSSLPDYPSLVLGAAEVTPFEVAAAFSTLANNGVRMQPRTIQRVINQDGQVLERHTLEAEYVVAPEDTYMLTHLLEGVLEHGTGRVARKLGFARPAAGKTGTTNDYGDAWFAGYTPDLVTIVWVGFDQRESIGLSGSQAALPMWTKFMKSATAGQPSMSFIPPDGITLVAIDRLTGFRATPLCPVVIQEAFYSGEEPTRPCPRHAVEEPFEQRPLPYEETPGELFDDTRRPGLSAGPAVEVSHSSPGAR